MKKSLLQAFLLLIFGLNCFAFEIPFDPFGGSIPKEIEDSKPSIEKDRFVYTTSIEFYSYSIKTNIYKYMDPQKGDNFIFFTKDSSINQDVFGQFMKEVLQKYKTNASYIYYEIVDDDTVIHKKYYFYDDREKPIIVYINISTDSGIVGLGISSTNFDVFSDKEFYSHLENWFNDIGENIYDKEDSKFEQISNKDSYIDLKKYVFSDINQITEEYFNIVFHGCSEKGFTKSFLIRKPSKKSNIELFGLENSKNTIICIDQKYMRTVDGLSLFTITPEEYAGNFIFINIKGILKYNENNIISIRIKN